MSITDELRDYAEDWDWVDTGAGKAQDRIEAIADRIDAEHERQCAESWMRGHDAWAAIDRSDEMTEHGWIRLPKDADGEYIHVGDMMEWVRYEDDDPTIVRTVSGIGNGIFFAWSDEQGRYAQYKANAYRHHHEPTVEDVLRDMLDSLDLDPTSHVDTGAVVAEYAAKLRLAMLRDMLDSIDLDPMSHVDTGAAIAEYAAKLRLAGDAE